MRKKLSAVLAAAISTLGLAACGASGGATLPEAPIGGSSSASVLGVIPEGTWRLASLRESGHGEVRIADPGTFTVTFGPDGRVDLKADCNRCFAGYTAGNGTLAVGVMGCTRAYCTATAPVDTTFASLVSRAQTWSSPDTGHLELDSDGGVLRFQR